MKIKEFKPKGSYSFSAEVTYTSKFFEVQTGEKISALSSSIGNFELLLEGKITVSNDEHCWNILDKLNKTKKFVKELVQDHYDTGYLRGVIDTQYKIKKALGLNYM